MGEFDSDGDEPAMQLTPDRARHDAADLQASLTDLAGLVTGSMGLQELLAGVAGFAARAIPGAEGAGVTLLQLNREDNRVEALAASDPFVAEIDEIQYVVLGEGPCITAALEGRTVRSGSLGGEKLWPRFGPRVGGRRPCSVPGAENVSQFGLRSTVRRRPRESASSTPNTQVTAIFGTMPAWLAHRRPAVADVDECSHTARPRSATSQRPPSARVVARHPITGGSRATAARDGVMSSDRRRRPAGQVPLCRADPR
jgi:hypothetical protein